MKQFTRNIAAVTTALQFLFLPFPAMAEETIQPYYTVTEVIKDGYFHESEFRSAPYFDLRIDGITLLNEKF